MHLSRKPVQLPAYIPKLATRYVRYNPRYLPNQCFLAINHNKCINQTTQLLISDTMIVGSRIIHRPARKLYKSCLPKTRRCNGDNIGVKESLQRRLLSSQHSPTEKITLTDSQKAALAQRRAYEYYRRKNGIDGNTQQSTTTASAEESLNDRNIKIAAYAAAAVIGALGATYAAVPLYKIFCQTTGFGGTTQRVQLSDWAETHDEMQTTEDRRLVKHYGISCLI